MYFSEQAINRLAADYARIEPRYQELRFAYVRHPWHTDRGREFAVNGFARRLQSLHRSLANVFELLPPERDEIPDNDTRHNAELQVHASMFHVFGAADNLAWIWVSERNITHNNGAPLPNRAIGIRKTHVVRSFSDRFRAHLQERERWFQYLEDYRHALAHRIPLYIPPYVVSQADEARYRALEIETTRASAAGDTERHRQLTAEQNQLKHWWPVMQHSFIEEANPVVLHYRLIDDFKNIDELGRMMLDELDQCR